MKKIVTIILLAMFSALVYAGDVARKGTTGADQLLIPVGARGIATGGAFISNLTGLESIYYNPAGLDRSNQTEALFSYMNYVADLNVSYFGAGTNLGELGSIGLTFKSIDFGDIPVTTSEFPDGTGTTYSPAFITLGLTYSKVITDRISVGANFKFINETIENTSASGFAIDFGVQYRFDSHISLGATLKNIGGNMSYSGADLQQATEIPGSFPGSPNGTYEIVAEEFQLPSYLELAASYNFDMDEQNNLLLGGTFVANNSLEDALNLGLEYGFMKMFFLRGGYSFALGGNDESIYGFTAGAGVDYQVGGGIGITFDYAYRDVKDFPTANHIFTVKLAFQ